MTDGGADGPSDEGRRSRRGRLGLRARVTVAFAIGAATLSAVLAFTTYGLIHHYLLTQRQTSAIRQTYTNARLVRQDLRTTNPDVAGVLASVTPATDTRSLIYRNGRWFSTSVGIGGQSLPGTLTSRVLAGAPAYQRFTVRGSPAVAIGIPIPSIGVDYFEIHSLAELQSTLDIVAVVLAVVAVAIALGGAAVGRWASGRLIRPLRDVAEVARQIGAGRLEQRLTDAHDRDLEPLVRSFNQMVGALQLRIERELRFTSDVSHEMRSPLTAVRTSAEVLSMFRSCLPTEGERALDLLELETGRFSAMVEDLLEISRMDAGAIELAMEELSIGELVRYAVEVFPEADVPLVVETGATHAVVHVDKRRLLRVMANLLDNAQRHGGGPVGVRLDVVDGYAEVAVDDAGPGVPVDERARIFERFYRGAGEASVRRDGGSGLGLALVAEHVRVHGGEVVVKDRPGGGARFTVRLPLCRR